MPVSRGKLSSLILIPCVLAVTGGCESKTDKETLDTSMTEDLSRPFAMVAGEAPVAEKRPVEIEQHGETRVDNYAWLRDENWQEVLRDPEVLGEDIRKH